MSICRQGEVHEEKFPRLVTRGPEQVLRKCHLAERGEGMTKRALSGRFGRQLQQNVIFTASFYSQHWSLFSAGTASLSTAGSWRCLIRDIILQHLLPSSLLVLPTKRWEAPTPLFYSSLETARALLTSWTSLGPLSYFKLSLVANMWFSVSRSFVFNVMSLLLNFIVKSNTSLAKNDKLYGYLKKGMNDVLTIQS